MHTTSKSLRAAHGMIASTARHGMAWHGMAWHGMAVVQHRRAEFPERGEMGVAAPVQAPVIDRRLPERLSRRLGADRVPDQPALAVDQRARFDAFQRGQGAELFAQDLLFYSNSGFARCAKNGCNEML